MYRQELDVQVKEMLRLARRKSGSFGKDCLSDPGKLRRHWSGCLDIVYYSPRDEGRLKAVREDARTMDDNASYADLLGFFSPSLVNPGIEMDKAYVAWADGEYTTRRNFTLLHEIGHYLQETDFDLMVRVGSFEDDYVAKRFEEDACNRFASMALLPDKFISEWLPGTVPLGPPTSTTSSNKEGRTRPRRTGFACRGRRWSDVLARCSRHWGTRH